MVNLGIGSQSCVTNQAPIRRSNKRHDLAAEFMANSMVLAEDGMV